MNVSGPAGLRFAKRGELAVPRTVNAKFHYTSWFGAGSEPVHRSQFGAGSELVRSYSSELDSIMEFGR